MSSRSQELSLSGAASEFLAELPPEERGSSQQEIYKFARWFGWERSFSGLTAAGIESYAEQLSLSDTDYIRKFEIIRGFLAYAKKKGWSKTNLALHLKARKGKSKARTTVNKSSAEKVVLTQQGFAELETELATLRSKRLEIIEEIRRAAADKDFRENAPLQAAREQRGQLEGRIIALEETLKAAVLIDEKQVASLKVNIGDSVILCDLASGQELRYTLVSPREVNPAKGKISSAAPIGQALIGSREGEEIEVAAPAGKRHYQVKRIER